jgi:hypothetical protein
MTLSIEELLKVLTRKTAKGNLNKAIDASMHPYFKYGAQTIASVVVEQ